MRMRIRNVTRKQVVVAIALAVGALHFVVGPEYRGPLRTFVTGYLIDILLPLVLYLLLSFARHPLWSGRLLRAAVVMAIGCSVEALQFQGVPLFGRTFDPMDVLMYGLGVAGGIALEVVVLSRLEPRPREGRFREAT
jgi:hypothetical protein